MIYVLRARIYLLGRAAALRIYLWRLISVHYIFRPFLSKIPHTYCNNPFPPIYGPVERDHGGRPRATTCSTDKALLSTAHLDVPTLTESETGKTAHQPRFQFRIALDNVGEQSGHCPTTQVVTGTHYVTPLESPCSATHFLHNGWTPLLIGIALQSQPSLEGGLSRTGC